MNGERPQGEESPMRERRPAPRWAAPGGLLLIVAAFVLFSQAETQIAIATLGFVAFLVGVILNLWVCTTWERPPLTARIIARVVSLGFYSGRHAV